MLRKRHMSQVTGGFSFVVKSLFVTLRSTSLMKYPAGTSTHWHKNSDLAKKCQHLWRSSMKKSLLALATLGAFAGAAHAQSSVTLYGIVDAGLQFVNNSGGHHLYQATSGNVQGSRWGLRGTEDLGGGLKAIFVLGNGFNIFSGKLGQGGDEFGPQAYVGLTPQ